MRIRPALLLAVAGLCVVAMPPSPVALAGPAVVSDAGWGQQKRFLHEGKILESTLRAEVAADGRAVVTFTRSKFESSCGRAKTRVLAPDAGWSRRSGVHVRTGGQMHLVAADRLAWLGVVCDGGVELRYSDAGLWSEPALIPAIRPATLRAGMNADGLVALARPSTDSIMVDTARPGEGWSAAELLSTGGTPVVDHVAVTDEEQVVVVWHIAADMVVSTLDDGGWSSVEVPGQVVPTRVAAGSDLMGNVVIARAVGGLLFVSSRAPDGSVTEPEQVADDLAYECAYTCVLVEVLPGGDAVVAWSPQDELVLGRRDTDTGNWTTELVDPSFGSLTVRLDAHDDGTVTLANLSSLDVWLCSWTAACAPIGYPPRTNHGTFAAAPSGSVVAISGRSLCSDWCQFRQLGGYVYSSEGATRS